MSTPQLIRPSMQYQRGFIDAAVEFLAEGDRPDWSFAALEDDFEAYIETIAARETEPLAGVVPETVYWLVDGQRYIGRGSVRHTLTTELMQHGGHISYEIRPYARGRGYGHRLCALLLDEARAIGLVRVLITCDDDNQASIRVIEGCGGVLENRIDTGRDALTRRYWLNL